MRDRNGTAVRGEVSSENVIVGSLTVELVAPNRPGVIRTSVEGGGSFEFDGLTPGQYQLRFSGAGGQILYEEPVLISGGFQTLTIRIPGKANDEQAKDATVSIRQLEHKVPSQAQKEFASGKAASSKGDQTVALDHFQKAAQIDPEFADAFTGIGISDMALGKLQQAADQFQKAVNLVPDHVGALANLSIVLCRLEHYHEAGEAARRALKLDPRLSKIRYVLGLSLATEGGDQAEALDNLQRAAAEVPKAHLLAAKILAGTDRREDAAKQVEDYLRSSPQGDTDRPKIEAWLEQLRK
jgi:tetratricopeptide (TPR) repeat protein